MSELPEHALKTVVDFQKKIDEYQSLANKWKASVNQVCEMYDVPLMYDIADEGGRVAPKLAYQTLRTDEFFGKPFSTCVREILTARKAQDLGPAEPREIFDTLRKGGFAFDSKDDDVAFRGMQISISKNSAVFVRLPSGQIGLEEWYERPRRPKTSRTALTSINSSAGWPAAPVQPLQIPVTNTEEEEEEDPADGEDL